MDTTVGTGLLEFLQVLRWRWVTLLVVALPIVAGATAYVESLPPYYESRALVGVSGAATADGYVGADLVRIGAPTFVSYITAPATLAEIADELGEDPEELEETVTAELVSETSTIAITVEHDSPNGAAEVANTAADQLLAFAEDQEGVLTLDVVAPATAPREPAGPPRRLTEAAALVLALGLGIAAALLRDRSQPRLRSVGEIEGVTGLPVMGQLPRFRGQMNQPAAAFRDPAVGTAVRSARINLERELQAGSTVVVTSATEGEGKTLVSSLLAIALSRIDLRVLLVDGDLRRASLSDLLGGPTTTGLLGVLRGEARISDEVRAEWADNLSVLPTARDRAGGELLTRQFPTLVGELRARYDVVIIDAPPILGADEGRALASDATATLLVVTAGTEAATVSESLSALRGVRANVIGAIANRVTRDVVDPYALVRSRGNLPTPSSGPTGRRTSV